MEQAITNMKIEDSRGNMKRMFYHLWFVGAHGGKGVGKLAGDLVSHDFTMKGRLEYFFSNPSTWNTSTTKISPYYVREFCAIAPHSEISVRYSIHTARKPTIKQLEEWEDKLTVDATAYTKLGNRYHSLNDIERAVRCYEKSLKALPTYETASKLADLYWQKDFDKWEKALSDFLNSEDLGLQHARAHQKLAYGYAHYGLWHEAKAHAEAAGQTWSAWGLQIASYACEGLAEWEESEHWIREKSQSYPSYSGKEWYYWCRRTGRGDEYQAQLLAKKYFSTEFAKPTRDNQVELGVYHLLEGLALCELRHARSVIQILTSRRREARLWRRRWLA